MAGPRSASTISGPSPAWRFAEMLPVISSCPISRFSNRAVTASRGSINRHQPRWKERSPRVVWRGSSVGQKNHAILEMPRARLYLLAQEMGAHWGDIGLAALFHFSEADADELRHRQLVKGKVSWKELSNYRFHIDIDGHAASFAGLFLKLLSGGLILKVQSPEGCAQWYYDRLVPGETYMPVRSDLSDLVEVVAHYRKHARQAERIARRGRELALSLTYEQEFAAALRAVAKRSRRPHRPEFFPRASNCNTFSIGSGHERKAGPSEPGSGGNLGRKKSWIRN